MTAKSFIVAISLLLAFEACSLTGAAGQGLTDLLRKFSLQPKSRNLYDVLVSLRDSKADFCDALRGMKETVESAKEARVVCELLQLLPRKRAKAGKDSELCALVALLEETENPEALRILQKDGVAQICRIFDATAETKDEQEFDNLLYVLDVLASFHSTEGTDRIIAAMRKPIRQSELRWSFIFRRFDDTNPATFKLLEELNRTLPQEGIRGALLEWFNQHAIEGTQVGKNKHPFDCVEGKANLKRWIDDKDPDKFVYAHAATAALPFIHGPERDLMLKSASEHQSVAIRMEGCWASAKLGMKSGFEGLQKHCLDPRYSNIASRYLEELDRKDLIPKEVDNPDFQAKAKLANWLTHPSELGKAPDELDILDHRELEWPLERRRSPFWLIKYRVKDTTGLGDDDVGVGIVGSVTFCMFSKNLELRSPEDIYAIHCCWEMEAAEMIQFVSSNLQSSSTSLPTEWQGKPLSQVELVEAAHLSPRLKYPTIGVSLFSATWNGEKGWLAVDGPRTQWYSQSEMPTEESEQTVLMVHIGRRLLGFATEPDRKKFLNTQVIERTPEQIVEAYSKLLDKADKGVAFEKRMLFKNEGPLGTHFDRYVDSLSKVTGNNRSELAIATFDRLLNAAIDADAETQKAAFSLSFGPMIQLLESYEKALKEANECERIDATIERLKPHLDHNFGYSILGSTAFRCGRIEQAEPLLAKLRPSLKTIYRTEEMSLLAEIWSNTKREQEAKSLLLECLEKHRKESDGATDQDEKNRIEAAFQHHLATLRRLYPDESSAILGAAKLPQTTLAK